MNNYSDYIGTLIQRFWDYADDELFLKNSSLDSDCRTSQRPPVFRKSTIVNNILISANSDEQYRKAIVSTLPSHERHRHFGSMRSSQALAQSVFGNLIVAGNLALLEGFDSDQSLPAFGNDLSHVPVRLEYNVNHLGEPRPTSVDVWFESEHRVAVECKLTEPEFGSCSRPRLKQGVDPHYCDGTYTRQENRQTRCSLSEIGVEYWRYIPELFDWRSNDDISPCTLKNTYQLVRNILAACVREDGRVDETHAHALVIYDANNPSFQDSGLAREQFAATRKALKQPNLLRSCSWQSLIGHIDSAGEMSWLTEQLRNKYGF